MDLAGDQVQSFEEKCLRMQVRVFFSFSGGMDDTV